MTKNNFSTYLDLVRFTAALLVVLEHAVLLGILPRVPVLTDLSHESVMVFFVLSGLVIAASSLASGKTPREYVVARAARILSVAVPALMLCYGVSAATRGFNVAAFLSSLLFLDGVWFNYGSVPFNGPFWSLSYEVWYYACWGVLLFVGRPRLRVAIVALLLVAMGPALAGLSGIWFMGALLAVHRDRLVGALRQVPRSYVAAAFVLSLAGIVLVASGTIEDGVRDLLRRQIHGWWRMRASEYLVTDYVIGVLVAVHLAAALAWFGDGRGFHDTAAGRAVRYCAGFTFTLYLFHYPMLAAVARVKGTATMPAAAGAGVVALTLLAVWCIAFVTERQLGRWRRGISRVLEVFGHASVGAVNTRHAEVAGSVL